MTPSEALVLFTCIYGGLRMVTDLIGWLKAHFVWAQRAL